MHIKEEIYAIPDGLGQIAIGRVGVRKQAQTQNNFFRNGKDKIRWTSKEEGELGKRISKSKKEGRKKNIKIQAAKDAELEDFVLEDIPEKKIEKKYPLTSEIGMPEKRIVKEVNEELSRVFGI